MSWAASSSRRSCGELACPVDLGGARRDPLVGEDADGVAEERCSSVSRYVGGVDSVTAGIVAAASATGPDQCVTPPGGLGLEARSDACW